jgi:pilus assembly protein Flp/PilA
MRYCREELVVQTLVSRFLKDESGTTSIEYALIAMLIGTGLVTVLTSIGTELKAPFESVNTGFTDANK